MNWHPVAGSAAASALLLWWRWDELASPANALWLLRTVAVLLAFGVAFALDDPTRPTLGAVPTPLWWRVTLRLICVGLPVALAWWAAILAAEWHVEGTVGQWALSLEALTLAAVVLALAGGLARWRGITDPGTVAAPTLLALGLLVPQLPDTFGLNVGPGPGWASAHVRWSVLLGVAVAVLALSLRDPAARYRQGSARHDHHRPGDHPESGQQVASWWQYVRMEAPRRRLLGIRSRGRASAELPNTAAGARTRAIGLNAPRECRPRKGRRCRRDSCCRPGRGSAVVTAVVTALGSASCASSPSPGPTSIEWGGCGTVTDTYARGMPAGRFSRLDFRCGTLDVALDPARAKAGTLAVQLIRVHQSGGRATKAPLLLIAGGPGQSGVDFAGVAAGLLPDILLDQFDLVGFDPRGVGRSQPIRCEHRSSGRPTFPDLMTATGFGRAASEMRQRTDRCAEALGSRAALFSTTATAVDIDRIRTALGLPTLTYLGWSYGAKLGAEYARMYPSKVRAAVLDAPSNPSTTWIETAERQVASFEDTFDRFTAWCAAEVRCAELGDVRAFVRALVQRAERSPIPSGRPGDDVPTYGYDIVDAAASAMYDDVRWPDLADGLAEAAAGDSGTLRGLVDAGHGGEDSNATDAQLVINCNDSPPGPTTAEIKAAGVRFARQFPLFGLWGSWQLFGCAFWEPERHTLPTPVAATDQPIVVVGTVHDPATPYTGAVAMAATLGTAELLTWEGNGHGAVGRNDCVTRLVADYLVSLAVPPHGTTCPA